MNNRGDIVGYTVTPTDGVLPVLWTLNTPSNQVTLQMPAGMDNGYAQAVNESGIAVGTMWSGTEEFSRAFVTKPDGTIIDLNTIKDAGSRVYHLVTADAINAGGVIVGTATTKLHVNGPSVTLAYIARPINMTTGLRIK